MKAPREVWVRVIDEQPTAVSKYLPANDWHRYVSADATADARKAAIEEAAKLATERAGIFEKEFESEPSVDRPYHTNRLVRLGWDIAGRLRALAAEEGK